MNLSIKFRPGIVITTLALSALACGQPPVLPPTTPTETEQPSATFVPGTPLPTHNPDQPLATPTVAGDVSLHYQAMRAGFESDVDGYADGLRYAVALELTTDPLQVSGTETIRYKNNGTSPLSDLVLRLYPNALTGQDSLQITAASIGGQSIEPQLDGRDTAARLALPQAVEPGNSVDLDLTFTLSLPEDEYIGYGRLLNQSDIIVLSSFVPMMSVYEEGDWWAEFPSVQGDPAYSESALWDVTLIAPTRLTVAASGSTVDTADMGDNRTYYHYVTGPMRDFSVALSPQFELDQNSQDGIQINVWSAPGESSMDSKSLDITMHTLSIFDSTFGTYPFAEFDMVESPMRGAGGIEYPGLVYIDSEEWSSDISGDILEITEVHETAHQWWYSLVGNNQVSQPWVDESLAQYSVEVYLRERYGERAAESIRNWYQETVQSYESSRGETMPVGLPVDQYDGEQYGVFVYSRGPLLYSQYEDDYGVAAVYKLLSDYFDHYHYRIAHSSDLEQIVTTELGEDAHATFEDVVYGK